MSKKTTEQSDQNLIDTVAEKREFVRNFRFSTAGSATRDVRAVRTAKKEIARCLTELNHRKRAQTAPNNK